MAKKKNKSHSRLDIDALIANENIVKSDISEEIENAMLSYAIKTIIDRAIPEIRDGLKPVHRRTLYGALQDGLMPNKNYEKNSGVVGTVIKYFHPHGDGVVYDSVVAMSQPWNYRYPLYDFHGNNGSIDGDSQAHMRYTEGKLSKLALTLLNDLDKECVDFKMTYNERTVEPEVLPGLFPNLLCNGASGIATGYTTEIPSHNLNEVVDAIIHTIQNPDCTIDTLMKYIKGPDFACGGILINNDKIKELYELGKASLSFKGKVEIEQNEESDNTQVIITELPPNVNKPKFVELLYKLCIAEKKIARVIDVRDESAGNSVRIVIELHKTGVADIVINELYEKTPLMKNNTFIMRAIVNQTPKVLSLKEIIEYYISHRKDVVTKRTKNALTKLRAKLHIQQGLEIVTNNINNAIKIIQNAETDKEAKNGLMAEFTITDIQASEVLDIKLRQLTKLNKNDILSLIQNLNNEIAKLEPILADHIELEKVIINELKQLKKDFGDERRTQLIDDMPETFTSVNNDPIAVVLTSKNNVKHITVNALDSMIKNGALKEKNEIFIQGLKCQLNDSFILILDTGEYIKAEFGDVINNRVLTDVKTKIKAVIQYDSKKSDKAVVIVTKKGLIKKTPMEGFKARFKRMAPLLELQNDEIIGVRVITMNDNNIITLATKDGLVHRFFEKSFKPTFAGGRGISGINLADNNEVVDFDITDQTLDNKNKILLFSKHENGSFGFKSMALEEFRPKGRISQGVRAIEYSKKCKGIIIGMVIISDDSFIINPKGNLKTFKFITLTPNSKYSKPEIIQDEIMIGKFFLE